MTWSRPSPQTGWRVYRGAAAGARPRRDPADTLRALLGSPNIASRRWVFEQYDYLVGSRTARRPEQADAAVLRLVFAGEDTGQAIAVSIDGNGRRVACDPYIGAAEAVLRVRREPRLRGRRAARPHQLPQLRQPREAARRMAADVRRRGPGGRLSRAGRPGRRRQRLALQRGPRTDRSTRHRWSAWLASCPTRGACASAFRPPTAASRTWWRCSARSRPRSRLGAGALQGDARRRAAAVRPRRGREALRAVREAVRAGALHSAHDVSDGGLACCIAEARSSGGAGRTLDLEPLMRRADVDARDGAVRRGPGRRPRVGPARSAARAQPSALAARVPRAGPGGRRRGSEWRPALLRSTSRSKRQEPFDPASICAVKSCDQHALPTIARTGRPFRTRRTPSTATDRATSAAFSASTRPSTTSPGSPTSRSSRSSTAARSRPGSRPARSGHITTQRDLGLVSQVFDERSLQALTGEIAIGHVRYSTTGSQRLGELAARLPRTTAIRSRWRTTATSSTPSSCTTSCARGRHASARPRTRRSSPR